MDFCSKFIDTLGPMRGQRGVAASPESLTPGSGAVDCFYRNIHPITESHDSRLTLLLFLFYFLYLLSKEDESCLHYNRFHLIFFYCFFPFFNQIYQQKRTFFLQVYYNQSYYSDVFHTHMTPTNHSR